MNAHDLKVLAFRSYDGDTHGMTPDELKLARAAEPYLTRDPETLRLEFDAEGAREAGLLTTTRI